MCGLPQLPRLFLRIYRDIASVLSSFLLHAQIVRTVLSETLHFMLTTAYVFRGNLMFADNESKS